eukprot:1367499-Rhodomonas_salina.5
MVETAQCMGDCEGVIAWVCQLGAWETDQTHTRPVMKPQRYASSFSPCSSAWTAPQGSRERCRARALLVGV